MSSYDEIVELEEEKGKLNDIAELDKIDVAEISLNADQIYFVPLYSPESTESDHHKFVYDLDDWSIVNVMRDGAIVSEELINSFQIEMNIPSLSSYSDDKLYIEAKVVDKENISSLDISIFDNRRTDTLLTGIDLDVGWSEDFISLAEDSFDPSFVFKDNNAPLFLSTGSFSSLPRDDKSNVQIIKGLSSASLPIAGSGSPFGKSFDSGKSEESLFASIPVISSGSNYDDQIFIHLNESVQTNDNSLSIDEVEFILIPAKYQFFVLTVLHY